MKYEIVVFLITNTPKYDIELVKKLEQNKHRIFIYLIKYNNNFFPEELCAFHGYKLNFTSEFTTEHLR